MRFICIQLFVIFSIFTGGCQRGKLKKNYSLTVTIETEPGNKLFMFYKGENDSIRVDSAIYKNGKFELKGQISYAQRALVRLGRTTQTFFEDAVRFTDDAMFVFLEEGNIQIMAKKTLRGARLSGTSSNNDLQIYTDSTRFYRDWLDGYRQRFGEAYRNRDNMALDSLSEENALMGKKLKNAEKNFFDNHSRSLVALDWLVRSYNVAREKSMIVPLFEILDEKVKNSILGQKYKALLEKTVSVEMGCLAPDFIAKNMNGKDVALSSFRGQYVLLDFWASWCGPCRNILPEIRGLYDKYYPSGKFDVLGISKDKERQKWLEGIKEESLPWKNVLFSEVKLSDEQQFNSVTSLPQLILIGPDGKVLLNVCGADKIVQMRDTIDNLFAK